MLDSGDRIGIWVVEEVLGAGGMGSVYRCHNVDAPRIKAAVKVLECDLAASQDAKARFVREAEILHRLDHPSVVRVRNVRMDFSPSFIEMEFVEGDSLDRLLVGGPLPFPAAFALMEQVASALAYIHAHHVRHRDVKPANLVVDADGRVKLVDFGLAVEVDRTRTTERGVSFGTVGYAPPEWLDPDRLDPTQWDLYAAGVVFYEMLTGNQAFPSPGRGAARQQAFRVMMEKQNHAPLDPGEGVPEPVRALIREMTDKDRAARPSDMVAVLERVAAIRSGLEAEGWTIPVPSFGSATPVHLDELRVMAKAEAPATVRDRRPIAGSGRLLPGIAVAGVAALGLLVAGVVMGQVLADREDPPAPAPSAPESAVERRSVVVAVPGMTEDYPLVVGRGGERLEELSGGRFVIFDLPVGALEVQWAAGQGCELDNCPGEACPEWCGSGSEAFRVEAGVGPAELILPIPMPRPPVSVSVPSLEDPKGGIFKRRPPELAVYMGGQKARIVGDGMARFEGVTPGSYRVVAVLGNCPASAYGCWPRGECPEGCSSEAQTIVVPARDDRIGFRLDVPLP